ncbi:MAG TPA: hypothetical protein VFP76_01840 [Gemmatimonadota bacterium]|nr:hypothetical protein [Gemmatimonadota bacterium]
MTHDEHEEYKAENRMKTARRNVVSAVFHDADDAEEAYSKTIERGYSREEVMVLMSDQARDEYFPSERVEVERESKAMEGAGVGGALGTALGAIAGAIVAVGTAVAIPGLGLVVAGPLLFGLAGAGAGGMTGGIVGGLVGAGMSKDRATVYKTAIEEGGIVLAVNPRNEADAEWLAEAWDDAGGDEIYRG